jgi:hypothetical protein
MIKEKEFLSYLDDDKQERLRVRLKIQTGELLDVVFQYESFIVGNWHPIVRYDCAHGFFHRDIMKPNGDKEKQAIEIPNLKDASKYAEQDLKDRWEWYREKYIKQLKKR